VSETSTDNSDPSQHDRAREFLQAAQEPQVGILREFVDFLLHQKKWWLPPIILVLLLLGVLILLSGSPAAPFIYTLW
jgi:hypothetical protein